MKRAPPFGFEVVVDYKRIFRSWHIGAVKTVLISGERADSVAHGSVLLGVAEFHVLPVHLPYQSTDSVGDDERITPVHVIVAAARLMSRTRGRECCFFISVI
jgi:hypothetical protein